MRNILLYLFVSSALFPWGIRGHRIVARIAENHLSENARVKVKDLLKEDTLTKVANEPDTYRSNSKWKCASPFHYVSIEDKESYLNADKHRGGDIVRALLYFEDVLRDKKSTAQAKATALKWLVHLVGDIHQPLHVGRACDRGGNSTPVNWFKTKSNLHKVWDAELINSEELSFSEYAAEIDKADEKMAASWVLSNYLDWAAEAQTVRAQVYTCLGKDGCCADSKTKGGCKTPATSFGSCSADAADFRPELEYAYIEKNRELLNRQLLKAGIRLAALLNRVFADSPLTAADTKARSEIDALKGETPNPVEECVTQALGSGR
ncbi:MAG: S1/P1 nuclease [Turneriella sp.]|nr:S1/P1 nuclease [Turneriella sp.]